MKRPKIRASGGGGTWYIQGTIDSELSKIILMSVGAHANFISLKQLVYRAMQSEICISGVRIRTWYFSPLSVPGHSEVIQCITIYDFRKTLYL